jgi:hypothetical protein
MRKTDAGCETQRRINFYSPCASSSFAGLRPPQRDENGLKGQMMPVTDKRRISGGFNFRPDKTRQALGMGSVIPYILFRSILEPPKGKQVPEGFYKGFQI